MTKTYTKIEMKSENLKRKANSNCYNSIGSYEVFGGYSHILVNENVLVLLRSLYFENLQFYSKRPPGSLKRPSPKTVLPKWLVSDIRSLNLLTHGRHINPPTTPIQCWAWPVQSLWGNAEGVAKILLILNTRKHIYVKL